MGAIVKISISFIFLFFAIGINADTHQSKSKQERLAKEFQNFVRIFSIVEQSYVDELSHKELFNKTIKGMMTKLDPHSSYLEPKEQEDLLENSSGKFGGLGIVISMEDGLVKVISPIDDTPAYRAGIQAGDLIIKIDNTSVRGLSLSDAVDLMRGEPKTPVKITILRKNKDPFELKIIRDIITIISVRGYLLKEDIGYARISSFQGPTRDLLKKKIKELQQKSQPKLNGLILDLRNNPGGLLNSAVEVSDLFLDNKGLIVYTKGRLPNSNIKFSSTKGDILSRIPIVVLINKGSASASEIVSGALQDHKRAVIIGEKSFGKGSVQTVIPFSDGYGLKLTTARYYTPSGRSIQAKGIEPDIVLKDLAFKDEKQKPRFSESESQLRGHLEEEDKSKPKAATQTKAITQTIDASTTSKIIQEQEKQKYARDTKEVKRLNKDYFINQAINALRVMQIW